MLRPPRFLDDDADAPALLPRATAAKRTFAALKEADQAFARWSCPASAECCQLAVTKRQPWLSLAEWELLEATLDAQGRRSLAERADGACPLLDATGKRCTVYDARPFGCRTFFCSRATGPARAPVEAADATLRKLADISAQRCESDVPPRPLLEWLASRTTKARLP